MKSVSENDIENKKRIDAIEESIHAALLYDDNQNDSIFNSVCEISELFKTIMCIVLFLLLSFTIVTLCLMFIKN
jgi:hypothetical protein